MPDARCTRGLVCNRVEECAHEHTGQRRTSDIPCAMALRLITRSPGDEVAWHSACLPTTAAGAACSLYGVDPRDIAGAVRIVVDELGADHVDLQLRLPGPQGHAQGRRCRGVGASGAVRGDRQQRAGRERRNRVTAQDAARPRKHEHITGSDAVRSCEDAGVGRIALHRPHRRAALLRRGTWPGIVALEGAGAVGARGPATATYPHNDDTVRMMRGDGVRRRRPSRRRVPWTGGRGSSASCTPRSWVG